MAALKYLGYVPTFYPGNLRSKTHRATAHGLKEGFNFSSGHGLTDSSIGALGDKNPVAVSLLLLLQDYELTAFQGNGKCDPYISFKFGFASVIS